MAPLLSAAALADPERPVDPERLIEQLLPEEMRDTVSHPFLRGGATILALALALGVSSAMSDRGVVAAILAWTAPLRASAAAPAVVLAAYVLGGLAFVPVTLLILTTMMISPARRRDISPAARSGATSCGGSPAGGSTG